MRRRRIVAVLAAAVVACSAVVSGGPGVAAQPAPQDTAVTPAAVTPVRLNQLQVIGTHNSYHVEPPPETIELYLQFDPAAIELAYTHAPLPVQFSDQGVRQIELDVFADPTGDLWRPAGRAGWKVFHIEQLDMDATCQVLVDCLEQVRSWSDGHPSHLPIAILLEVKDSADFPVEPNPVPVTPALLATLDAEIRSVFPPERIIEPDDVRGARATLEEAVLLDGWPAVDDVRGQVLFLLDNQRDNYLMGAPSLEGRVAFTPSAPGAPDAAFVKANDPLGPNLDAIRQLVSAGYVVRTRADGPVLTARSGDTTQRDAALASGAQWVSTDYPVPGMSARWGTSYVAAIPGGTPARCNPVNAPVGCVATDIENSPLPTTTTTTTATATTSTTTPSSTAPSPPTTVVAAPASTAPARPVRATPTFAG